MNDSIQPGLIDNPGTDENEEKDFPVPAPLESHGPARVISMCNQKGHPPQREELGLQGDDDAMGGGQSIDGE